MGAPKPSAGKLHEAHVLVYEPVAQGIYRLVLGCPELAGALSAGQFVNVAVAGEERQLARIPLSFTEASAQEGTLELVYALLGPGTKRLALVEAGSTLSVLGPLGHGWRIPKDAKRVLLVCGGTGMVPVYAAALALARATIPADIVVGARSKELLWGLDELRARVEGEVIAATDDGSAGVRGFASGPALELLDRNRYDLALVCGPEPLMKAVAERAEELGVACQVSMERTMACGFGACNTCAVKTTGGMKGACMDGPVFDAKEVVWA